MILLLGIPSEPPMRLVTEALTQLGARFQFVNQRDALRTRLTVRTSPSGLGGRLDAPGGSLDLDEVSAVYARPMDTDSLPELRDEPRDSPRRRHGRQLQEMWMRWMDRTRARVLNRPSAMASNGSKPFQCQWIREAGFEVPPTLITNDPEAILEFRARHGSLIFKSISGVRSIVTELTDDLLPRLRLLRSFPVQFQARIPGDDIRVHTIGDRAFAARACTPGVDYRYAARQGHDLELEACDLPESVARRCCDLARRLGLDFAGLDFKRTPEGRWVCLEANPCPAFSFYEEATGLPIAAAVAEYLAKGKATGSHPST